MHDRVCLPSDHFPCQPGTGFWSSVFRSRSAFSDTKAVVEKLLKFPIPNTFVVNGSDSFGIVSKGGGVEVFEDMSPDSILEFLEMEKTFEPVAVRKRVDPADITRTQCRAVSGSALGSIIRKLADYEDLICLQSFCGLAKASMKPRVFRVCYSSNSEMKPFAYVTGSTLTPIQMLRRQDEEEGIEIFLTRQFCVSTETSLREHVYVTKVAGRAIDSHVEIAKQVAEFIQNVFFLRISSLIVDIVENKLVQVKSFTVKPFVTPSRQLALTGEKYSVRRRGSATTTENAVWSVWKRKIRIVSSKCLVCNNSSKDSDIGKKVTGKLVHACVRSLAKRGISHFDFSSKNVLFAASRKGCMLKCCDSCYSLIVNESELNKLGRKISFYCLSLNSDLFISQKIDQAGETHGEYWRLLVGVGDMHDVPQRLTSAILPSPIVVSFKSGAVTIKFRSTNSFQVVDLFLIDPQRVGDKSSSFLDDISVSCFDKFTGSVSILNRLISLARISNNTSSLSTVPCFLGEGRWSVDIILGVSKESSNFPIPESTVCIHSPHLFMSSPYPIGTRPLPDAWLIPLTKLRRKGVASQAGRRSRSNSFSKITVTPKSS